MKKLEEQTRSSNNYETCTQFSYVPEKITKWRDELHLHRADADLCESVNTSMRQVETELSTACEQYKQSLLLNRVIGFKQGTLDAKQDGARLGQVKCTEGQVKNNHEEQAGHLTSSMSDTKLVNLDKKSSVPSMHGLVRSNSNRALKETNVSKSANEFSDSSDSEQYLRQSSDADERSKTRNVHFNISKDRDSKNGGTNGVRRKWTAIAYASFLITSKVGINMKCFFFSLIS